MPAVYDVRERAHSTPTSAAEGQARSRGPPARGTTDVSMPRGCLNQTTDIAGGARRRDRARGQPVRHNPARSMTTNQPTMAEPVAARARLRGGPGGSVARRAARVRLLRARDPGPRCRRRRPGVGAVGVVELRRRRADVPAAALDRPHRHGATTASERCGCSRRRIIASSGRCAGVSLLAGAGLVAGARPAVRAR